MRMACSAMRVPLIRNAAIRHYAAAAAPQLSQSSTINFGVADNNIAVAAVENKDPVAQISIIFKAGPRYESYDNQGISHMLRICAGLTTNQYSTFAITRNLQQLGGELTATADREYISYTLRIIRNNVLPAVNFLEAVATGQQFRPWEVSDEIPRLRHEISTMPQNVRLIELLYKAAYRRGLGYSLYCPKRHVGKISSESLQHFVSKYYTAPRCAVVASGIKMQFVRDFASKFQLPSEKCQDNPSKYYGGEIHKERNSELASVAVAVEGTSLQNQKDAISFAVLQKVAGDGPQVKWGNCHSALHKAVSSATNDPFAIAAFNASHSDSGLFGFILSAPGESAGNLTKAGVNWLRSPQFSESDVERAKANLKASVLAVSDNKTLFHESMSHQILSFGKVMPTEAIVGAIDKTSSADVKSVAQKISKGKLSMAAIGDLSTVPHLDEL